MVVLGQMGKAFYRCHANFESGRQEDDGNESSSVGDNDRGSDTSLNEGDEKRQRRGHEEEIIRYEWEEELDEYDKPDIYPSEKDYKWVEEVITDSEEEEEAVTVKSGIEDEAGKSEAADDQKSEGAPAESTEQPAVAETAEGETAAEEEEEEQFVFHKPEEEEEEEQVQEPVKKYKTLLVRKLIERAPKIHYNPEELRVQCSDGSGLPDRPFHFLYSFGYDCQRMNNVHVLDEETLVFMSGFVLTFYNHVTSHKTYLRALGGYSFGALATHPSRRLFAAAEKGHNPIIGIWSWNKLQLFRKLSAGTEKAYASIQFSPDGKLFASQGGEPDFLITVWNWLNETPVLRVKSHAQDVFRVTFSKELAGLLTTSGLCHIKFWKMAHTFTGLKLKGDIGRFGKTELTDIEGYVEMPDGKVVSGSEWGNLLVWENGLVIAELCESNDVPCHKGIVRFIRIVEGDFYTTGQDGKVRVWSFEAVDTAEIHTTEESLKVSMKAMADVLINDDADIWSIVQDHFCHDPVSVFWFAQDGMGIIWKIDLSFLNTAKEPRQVLLAHGGPIVACATSPRTYLIATLGNDGRVIIFDYVNKELIASRLFSSPGTCLIWPSHGVDNACCTLICGFDDGVLRVLRISQKNEKDRYRTEMDNYPYKLILHKIFKPHKRKITCILMDSLATLLVTASEDGTIFFFNVKEDFAPIMFVSLRENEPIQKLLWYYLDLTDEDEDDKKGIIAICNDGIIQLIRISKFKNFDNSVTYFSTESELLYFIQVKSIKSVLRRNEELERRRKEEEEKQEALEAELRRMVEDGLETQSQQNIRLLMEAEQKEKEETSKPKTKEKKWVPYIPPTPTPILEVIQDRVDKNIIHITRGGYDTAYIYSIRLIPGETDSHEGRTNKNEPFNAVPLEDSDEVAVTKTLFVNDGRRVLMGFQDGRLRMTDLDVPYDVTTMKYHWTEGIHDFVKGAITCIDVDFDRTFLFTTGNDGNCFMFSTVSEDKANFYCSSAGSIDIPYFEENDVSDILDQSDYTLEESKSIAKELAILAAAKKNKAARIQEISRLRLWFTDVVRKNNELPEDIRLSPVEFQMASDNVARHDEAMVKSLEKLRIETAWESEKASLALNKLKSFYKDPIECEHFTLRAFNSPLKLDSFRHTKLPAHYYEALNIYLTQAKKISSTVELIQEAPSEIAVEVVKREPRPKRISGIDKFVYQRLVRLWRRRQKKVARKEEWGAFLRTNPEGKELEHDMIMIQDARLNMGDLKLKTAPDYKAPEHQKLTVSRARKRLIDLEEKIHRLKGSFNNEMLELRRVKLNYLNRINDFKSKLMTAQESIPEGEVKPVPNVPDLGPDESPYTSTSYTREEVLAYKQAQEVKGQVPIIDKTTKVKKAEVPKRRPQKVAVPQDQEKPVVKHEKDIGDFVQIAHVPPSALEREMKQIKLIKARFYQEHYLKCIEKEKFNFDVLLKLLRHKKVKVDYFVKTVETSMVLLMEEFLQAKRCEAMEAKLEGIIADSNKEKRACTASLKNLNKQIENKRKEIEEIGQQRAALLREVLEIAIKAPQYEKYLVRVFKKKIKKAVKDKHPDEDELEESSESDSDESDDFNMEEEEDTDDDLDVDLPPQDLNPTIYEDVIAIREKRVVVDDLEDAVKASLDDLISQANGLNSRINAAEKVLKQTKTDLDLFIFDKQNKLNSLDFAVSVKLHQILYLAPNLNDALITSQSTIHNLRQRIPQLEKEKVLQKKEVVEARKNHFHLLVSKQKFLNRLEDKDKECDHEMMLKFGRVKPLEILENFEIDGDILALRARLQRNQEEFWAEERRLHQAFEAAMAKKTEATKHGAAASMVESELLDDLVKSSASLEASFELLSVKASDPSSKTDLIRLKQLILRQWRALRDLRLQIVSLTYRPLKTVLPPIQEHASNK